MVQFNLLPDVKLEFLAARRNKRLIITVCILLGGVAMAFFVALFMVVNFQKSHIGRVDKDIKRTLADIQSNKDLDKVLTIQNQLMSLPDLHNKKPVNSRIAPYLTQITPADVKLSSLDIDYEKNTINISGLARVTDNSRNNLKLITKYVDTLKFTEFKAKDELGQETTGKAFSEVVLASFGREEVQSSYQINFKFDPVIFSGQHEVALVVPQITSTRSVTEKPLFESDPLAPTEQIPQGQGN